MSSIMTIKLSSENDRVQIKKTSANGIGESRVLTMTDFLSAMGEIGSANTWHDVTSPQETVMAKINGRGERIVEFSIPGRKRTFLYYSDEYVIPMPTLHFQLQSSTTSIKGKCKCWVEKNGEEFLYPFGNVSTDSEICWGNTKLPKAESFAVMREWVDLFFASVTNDDYYSSKAPTIDSKPMQQRELLAKLQDLDEYPDEYLIKKY